MGTVLAVGASWISQIVRTAFVLALAGNALACVSWSALPPKPVGAREAPSIEQMAIEKQRVCVGAAMDSAGTLAETLYYRAAWLPDGKIAVGYFAFYSDERPWGNNWLTWTVLPALGIDLVYSRSLMIAPGLQRAIYGKGDVEGFRIVYDVDDHGGLHVSYGLADNSAHSPVRLEREDLLSIDPLVPTLYSDTWSHQLGARGRSKDSLASLTCFVGDRVRPLPEDTARDFRIDARAVPAHVERLAGSTVIDSRRRSAGTILRPAH